MRDFSNKVAIITGGSKGIGKAICRIFARTGAKIIFNYSQDDAEAEKVLNEMLDITDAMTYKVSVTDPQGIRKMVDEVESKYGRIDFLINNAGRLHITPFLLMSEKEWDEVMDVNLKGTFYCTKAVVPGMIKQKSGKIVNIASIVALAGIPGQAHYAATKGAIISFTKSLAKELAPYGINVNAVAPGLIDDGMIGLNREKRYASSLCDLIALKRMGRAEEVAETVLFLCSDHASYITGQVVIVDGGLY